MTPVRRGRQGLLLLPRRKGDSLASFQGSNGLFPSRPFPAGESDGEIDGGQGPDEGAEAMGRMRPIVGAVEEMSGERAAVGEKGEEGQEGCGSHSVPEFNEGIERAKESSAPEEESWECEGAELGRIAGTEHPGDPESQESEGVEKTQEMHR